MLEEIRLCEEVYLRILFIYFIAFCWWGEDVCVRLDWMCKADGTANEMGVGIEN